jgi:hypothetical protein
MERYKDGTAELDILLFINFVVVFYLMVFCFCMVKEHIKANITKTGQNVSELSIPHLIYGCTF